MADEIRKLDADYEQKIIDKAVSLMFVRAEEKFFYQLKILGYITTTIKWVIVGMGCIWIAVKNRALFVW